MGAINVALIILAANKTLMSQLVPQIIIIISSGVVILAFFIFNKKTKEALAAS